MNKMEETALRQRKQQLEAQLEYINERLNGKGARPGPNQGGSDDMLRECALLIALREWESQPDVTPFFSMAFVTKANKEEKKEAVPTVPIAATATTTTTTTTIPVKATNAPTTTVTTEPKTTLKMVINERLLDHYTTVVKQQVSQHALNGEARITIDSKHVQVLVPFEEYCRKEGIIVAHVSRQVSSIVVTLTW